MPDADARVLDVRTSRVAERIAAVDDFVAAGYEVHLNLSPVVLRDGWEADWTALLSSWTTSSRRRQGAGSPRR